jgi:peptidyl-prolyl cis-trans isomerase D
MEQSSIRRTFTRAVTLVLFGLLIASFALWGIGDIFRSQPSGDAVIKVGEQEVGPQAFQQSFQREFNRVRQQVGGQLDMETARQLGLVDQLIRQTVTRLLFDQTARDMGLAVSDEQVVQRIREQPAFQSAGQFDRQRFETVLQRSGLTEARYVDLLKSDIDRQHLATAATGGLAVPQAMADALYRYRNEERVADYLVVRQASFEVATPETSTLEEYHEANSQAFMAPAYRKITYLHLNPEDLLDEVKVSEEELRQAYQNRKGEFGQPATRTVRQIVLDNPEQAEKARALLAEGRSFAAVAEQVTGRAPAELGQNTRDELLPALAGPVFELAEGEISQPIESTLGWHLVKVDAAQSGETPAFEEVRDKLRRELAMDKAIDSLVQLANTVDDTLAGGATLEEAAQQVGLETRTIDQVSRQGRAPDGSQVPNLPPSGGFLETAFETPQGQQSLLKETDEGGYYVLRVDGVTPEQVRPFDRVRDRVLERWRADQRAQKAEDAAKEIAGRLDEGAKLTAIAGERGLEVQTTRPLTRSGNQQAGPAGRALASKLFEVKPGGAVTASVQDGMAVGRLTEVRPAKPAQNAEAVAALKEQLRQGLRSDVLAQYANALRQRYDVQVNQQLLDRILNRSS